ncbi:MAG: ankyrin repeat domain-containing protein [Alphaproteobacteria bacterium]|nr:ankyrin repeat domain-containing protein [Alphaproteobacteria bacterium]
MTDKSDGVLTSHLNVALQGELYYSVRQMLDNGVLADKTTILEAIKQKVFQKDKSLFDKMIEQVQFDETNTAYSYFNPNVLIEAARSGVQIDSFQKLIDKGASIKAKDANDVTVLMGLLEVIPENRSMAPYIQVLLNNKADINATDDFGRTALILAVAENDTESAKILIAGGAKIDAKTKGDYSAYDFAYKNGNVELLRLLTPCQVVQKQTKCPLKRASFENDDR